MWFYSNFEWEKSLNGEFNSTSNEYPLGILFVDLAPQKWEIHEKTWCWCQHHIFSCLSCFSWSKVHQKYAEWVLVGCAIEFPIQKLLLFEIWVKPHGYMLKISVERLVFHFLIIFYLFTFLLIFFTILLLKCWLIPYGWHHQLESYWFL